MGIRKENSNLEEVDWRKEQKMFEAGGLWDFTKEDTNADLPYVHRDTRMAWIGWRSRAALCHQQQEKAE